MTSACMTCGTASPRGALALGESLTMIGKLLGHTQVQTTARYAHLGRHSVKVAAARIADSLETDMDTPLDASAALKCRG